MKYIIYNDTGKILQQIDCQEGEISNYLSENNYYMEYSDNPINKHIVDGLVKEKEMPEKLPRYSEVIPELSIRQYRTTLLFQSDWTQMPDSPLSDEKKQEWSTYRQALRDLPETYISATSIDDIIWPTKPE